MIRIKVLNELRQLLNEVSFEEAKKTLDGSKFNKKLLNIIPKEDLERRSLEMYLEKLKKFRKMYLNKGFSALKENKKFVIKLKLRN